MICKYCNSERVVKDGKVKGKQQYVCRACGHKFVEGSDFPKMRVESRIISTAIDMYYEGLSIRKVQNQLQKIFGIQIGKSAVWKWIMKYAKMVSGFVTVFSPQLSGVWHVDETAIKCKGVQKWFWETIDEETKFLVASHLSGDRTIEDVVRLFSKGMAMAKKKPKVVCVDGLPAYERGFNKVFYTMKKATRVQLVKKVGIRARVTNNVVERLHGTLKDRTRVARGLKEASTVETLLDGWTVHYDYVRPHQSLKGKTPAQVAGINVKNDWHTLIKMAIKNNTQEQQAYAAVPTNNRASQEREGMPVLAVVRE